MGKHSQFLEFFSAVSSCFSLEWTRTIQRDYNHPCIILWNMMNESWGYSDTDSEESFLAAYSHVIRSIYASDLLCGFCYTQLSDIQ